MGIKILPQEVSGNLRKKFFSRFRPTSVWPFLPQLDLGIRDGKEGREREREKVQN